MRKETGRERGRDIKGERNRGKGEKGMAWGERKRGGGEVRKRDRENSWS